MASPKDKPKAKPNRLTNDFKYVPEKKAVAKYDPLSATSRYLSKLGDQLAEETAYQMKAIPEVYRRDPIEGLKGTARFLADGANQLFVKPVVHGYHATEGLVEHNDGTIGSNLANLGILGLSLVDIADMTELSKPLTHMGISAIKGIGKEMTQEIGEDLGAKLLRQELVNANQVATNLGKQELHQLEHHLMQSPKEALKTFGSHQTVKQLEDSTGGHGGHQELTHASNEHQNNVTYNQDIAKYIDHLDSLKTQQAINDYYNMTKNQTVIDTPNVPFFQTGKVGVPSRVKEQLQSMFMR